MLQKKLMDYMKTQGRLQRINPFKEIDGKEYNKKHNNKQKELLEKISKEIQQGNKYLEEFSNINDETPFRGKAQHQLLKDTMKTLICPFS
jgi:hypothetical protein